MDELFRLFERGGPIMWPMLFLSLMGLTVVVERLAFMWRERRLRCTADADRVLTLAEQGRFDDAVAHGLASTDYVARILAEGLEHRETSMSESLLRGANAHLARMNEGLSLLDTIITAAPLLGLLGTVTGMMRAFFGLQGTLDAPVVITGGIAEALIATAAGLAVAIVCLFPFNYCNARLEAARHEVEDACNKLEVILAKHGAPRAEAPLTR